MVLSLHEGAAHYQRPAFQFCLTPYFITGRYEYGPSAVLMGAVGTYSPRCRGRCVVFGLWWGENWPGGAPGTDPPELGVLGCARSRAGTTHDVGNRCVSIGGEVPRTPRTRTATRLDIGYPISDIGSGSDWPKPRNPEWRMRNKEQGAHRPAPCWQCCWFLGGSWLSALSESRQRQCMACDEHTAAGMVVVWIPFEQMHQTRLPALGLLPLGFC
jgi:hypothetical protein